MKRILSGLILSVFLAAPCQADDDLLSDPESKARRAHEMSMSDVMYQQEDFRALYYQNETMIRLLKEIKEELRSLNTRQAKESDEV